MKTKLLKRVRKNYRIVENGLGEQSIHIRNWIGIWEKPCPWEYFLVNYKLSKKSDAYTVYDTLVYLLRLRYSYYTRRSKIKAQKKSEVKVIWYSK